MIKSLDVKEQQDEFYNKVLIKSYCKLYAVCAILGEFDEALDFIKKIEDMQIVVDASVGDQIRKDKETIKARIEANSTKIEADRINREGDKETALEKYREILSKDWSNVRVMSNIAQIMLQKEEFDACRNICTDILLKLRRATTKIGQPKGIIELEAKALVRRANANESIGDLQAAHADLQKVNRLNINNASLKSEIERIRNQTKKKIIAEYKLKANNHLKKMEVTEALELYNKCIQIFETNVSLERAKIQANRITCYLHLGQFDRVSRDSRKLRIMISKVKSVAIVKKQVENEDECNKLDKIVLMKLGHAETQLDNLETAREAYEECVKLDPTDEKAIRILEQIKAKLIN